MKIIGLGPVVTNVECQLLIPGKGGTAQLLSREYISVLESRSALSFMPPVRRTTASSLEVGVPVVEP